MTAPLKEGGSRGVHAGAYLDLIERLRTVANNIGSAEYPEVDGLLRNAADALDAIASTPEGGWFFSWKAADEDRMRLARGISNSERDTERLDQIAKMRASIYKSGSHWVVVDETSATRKGCIGDTLRAAIDAATPEPKP